MRESTGKCVETNSQVPAQASENRQGQGQGVVCLTSALGDPDAPAGLSGALSSIATATRVKQQDDTHSPGPTLTSLLLSDPPSGLPSPPPRFSEQTGQITAPLTRGSSGLKTHFPALIRPFLLGPEQFAPSCLNPSSQQSPGTATSLNPSNLSAKNHGVICHEQGSIHPLTV